jgi:hypothetical protein
VSYQKHGSKRTNRQNWRQKIAHQAQELQHCLTLHADDEEHPFEQWFVTWVQAAFKAKEMLRFKI